MNKRKVLILNPILYTPEKGRKMDSISDSLMISVCKGFIEIGYEPTLVADKYYMPLRNEEYGFEIIYLDHFFPGIFSPFKLPFPKGLISILKERIDDIDFIITSEVFSIYSYIAVKYAKKKTIVWHELALHNKLFCKIPSKFWYSVVAKLRFSNVMIAPRSEKSKLFISEYCDRIDDELYQHPININYFKANRKKENYFISVSQLVARKQVDKIVTQFFDFIKSHDDFMLIICGDGEERANISNLVQTLNLTNKVIFKGSVNHNELGELLAKSKALLVYTKQDNSILTISEAIACGTPILTTSVPDNSLFVKENNLGIVKDNWTSDDMENMVLKNEIMVDNCITHLNELTNTALATRFVELSKRL